MANCTSNKIIYDRVLLRPRGCIYYVHFVQFILQNIVRTELLAIPCSQPLVCCTQVVAATTLTKNCNYCFCLYLLTYNVKYLFKILLILEIREILKY